MRIADILSDSIVDGYGLRLTIYTQGCYHACPSCHNPQTHDPKGGTERPLSELYQILDRHKHLSGITLSGGDPFLQAEDCVRLAQYAHQLGMNVWTYTGYRYEEIENSKNEAWHALLQETDVLVDGKYMEDLHSYTARFRGSSNQRLIDMQKTRLAGHIIPWQEPCFSLAHFTVPES